jgi:hypothetical protein
VKGVMRAGALLLVLLFGGGCISINTFGSPRTVAPKELAYHAGISSFVYNDDQQPGLPIPTGGFGLRVGIIDQVDVGAQLFVPVHFRADVKWNFLRAGWIDLAAGAGLAVMVYPIDEGEAHTPVLVGGDLPLMVGFNVGDVISLVPSIAPAYVLDPATGSGGGVFRGSFAIRIRLSDGLVLTPEAATVFDPQRATPVDFAFGLALGFGAQP